MSMQDPVADLLTRIRNAQAVNEKKITCPPSLLKTAILKVLLDEGYIESFEKIEQTLKVTKKKDQKNGKSDLVINLKYFHGAPVIQKIKRISKPGLRIYRGADDLPEINSGMGIVIVSTPQGVMTGKTAKSRKLGGEVLCSVE